MVPCGLAGHRHCTVRVSSHTLHLHVVNMFSSFLSLSNFTEFFFITIFIYLFINFFIIMNILLSIFVLEFFLMPNRFFYLSFI